MFNKEKIQALEQSVATLTEDLNSEKEAISNLLECLKTTDGDVNKLRSEKDELENKFDAFKKVFEEVYKVRVDRTLEEMNEKSDKDKSAIREEIKKVTNVVTKLEEKSNNADKEHDELLAVLKENNEKLVKKCEELQLANVQIMNQHNDMIKRYEESIKAYAEQTQAMKDNILKKMNAKNIISVVEE
jgi:ABC-type transporter Mla subunit MlaD